MRSVFKRLNWLMVLVLTMSPFLWTACDEDDPEEVVKQKLWISSEEYVPANAVTSATVKNLVSAMSLIDPANAEKYTNLANMVKYDLKFYKVKYKTLFKGDTTIASGMMCVPVALEKKESFPILSFQHGTIAKKSEAPTVSPLSGSNALVAYLACTGMIVLMPDYIGFGESSEYLHPFLHKEYTTNAVLDFIRAGKEFIALENPVSWNEKLFLAGYSQGGSATLGALSAIENNSANADIQVTATSCGAGPYSLTGFRDWLVSRINFEGKFEKPWYLAYMVESFSEYSGVTTPYSAIFKEDIAPIVHGVVDGIKSDDDINKLFPEYLGSFLSPDFLNNDVYGSNADYATLRTALEENSIQAWALKSKLALYYGQNDIWVPASLSVNMISAFQNAGGGTNLVSRSLPGLNHTTAVAPMMIGTLEWFRTF